jgi:hypothetical protein
MRGAATRPASGSPLGNNVNATIAAENATAAEASITARKPAM